MEKQKSFAVKPIKFLVSSFTIFFSIIFVIFCFTWVFKSTSPINLSAQNLGSNSVISNTSSENLVKNSILLEKNLVGHGNSSSSSPPPSQAAAAADVAEEEGKGSLVISNSSSTPFGNSSNTPFVNVGGVNVSDNSSSKKPIVEVGNLDGKIQELNNVVVEKRKLDCDVTRGNWVFDESYPLYSNSTCPFIDEGFGCESNGRLDKGYMKWRWQPQDCDFPRFNASKMLELIRGKRLVFVGDSLNRNQWESMLCLLMGGVRDPRKVYEARGRRITKERGNYCFKFEEYKCSVEFYVSHYLVHESKARIGKKRGQTLRIDTMDKGSSRWRGANILVFNTAHWWSHQKTKAG